MEISTIQPYIYKKLYLYFFKEFFIKSHIHVYLNLNHFVVTLFITVLYLSNMYCENCEQDHLLPFLI